MTAKKLLRTMMMTTALTVAFAPGPAAAGMVEDLKNQVDYLTQLLAGVQQTLQNVLAQQNAQGQQIQQQQQQLTQTSADVKKADPGFSIKWEPAPSIKSNDGRFEMNLRGRIFADAGWVSNDETATVKATEFRAARLGIEGKAWNNVKYKFEIDFADNAVSIKDAFVGIQAGKFDVTLGQHKPPVSLDELTSSRFTTFMERAAFTGGFGFDRFLGISVAHTGEDHSLTIGAYRGTAGTLDVDEGTLIAARATYSPKIGEKTRIHVGASVRYRETGEGQALFRYRQRPFSHITSMRFVDTGARFDKDVLFGVEAAVMHGPFTVVGEYVWDRAQVPGQSDRANFHGYYAEVGYFLTGEHRTYEGNKGEFGRIDVKKPVLKGGWGAWQVAYRYDVLDLSDVITLTGGGMLGILGGEQKTHIFGVNWYWNKYMRMMLNYSRSKVANAFLVGANGADGMNTIDTFGIRTQVDW